MDSTIRQLSGSAYVVIGPEGATNFAIIKARDGSAALIDADIRRIYRQLHREGEVHSVEAWTPDGALAGGLYGVGLGGLFAGESMFHRPDIGRDASKVALVALVQILSAAGRDGRLLDVQWATPHLESLGVVEVSRPRYLELLAHALELPDPDWAAPTG